MSPSCKFTVGISSGLVDRAGLLFLSSSPQDRDIPEAVEVINVSQEQNIHAKLEIVV